MTKARRLVVASPCKARLRWLYPGTIPGYARPIKSVKSPRSTIMKGTAGVVKRARPPACLESGRESVVWSPPTCPRCHDSGSSSNTRAPATAAGRSRKTPARSRERSTPPCAKSPASGRSSSTARAAPTPGSTRSARSRTSMSARPCRPTSLARRDQRPAAGRHPRARAPSRCRTSSTRATTRVSRTYVYQIARRRTAFAKPFVWWIKDDLRVGAMRAALARLHRPPGLPRLHRRRPGREVHAGRDRPARAPRSRRRAARRRRGLAFPVEDGPADGRRRRRGRPRRPAAGGRAPPPALAVGTAGEADGASVGPLPRAGRLPGRCP